jgi:hypothetical protein
MEPSTREAAEIRELTFPDGRWALHTDLPGGVWISTVEAPRADSFDGMLVAMLDPVCDRAKGRSPGQYRYETMVFRGEDRDDLDCQRYLTQDEARAGHSAMVRKWSTENRKFYS